METEKELIDWFDEFAMNSVEIDPNRNIIPELKGELLIDEELKKLLQPLPKETYDGLEKNILEYGLLNPIITWNNYIVDGHNRYEICKKHNIKIKTDEKKFSSKDDVKLFMIELQIRRRDTNAFTKLELMETTREILRKKGKESYIHREEKKKGIFVNLDKDETNDGLSFLELDKVDSRKELAKITKTSTGTIGMFDRIKNVIDEPTKMKIRNDETTIGKVYKEIKNKEYKQKELNLKDTSNIVLTNDDIKLYNCDILDTDIEDNTLDIIITDPPYPREFLNCWKKLAEFAVKKLKPGGVVVAMSGQSYLPDVYKNMTIEGLNYYWTGCINTPGVSPILQTKRLLTNWKPLLIYVKGEYTRTFQKTDVYVSENYNGVKEGHEYHKWGQSLNVMNKIINDWTYTEDVICDPFLGGGTTAISCLENKRKCIGIELNTETYEIAKKRINDYDKTI